MIWRYILFLGGLSVGAFGVFMFGYFRFIRIFCRAIVQAFCQIFIPSVAIPKFMFKS